MARKSKAGDSNSKAPLDLDRLRNAVGEAVFQRGKRYYAEGRVEIVSISKGRVLGTVAGSETYRTTLFPAEDNVAGECSCPAFETFGFCKHVVAIALAVASAADGDGAETRADRIRAYLRSADTETLVELIPDRAAHDPDLLAELAFAADMASGADDEALFSR